MTQELRNMRIRQVSLVDKGANGRTFALLKRDAGAVRKDVPATFGMLQGAREIATWLPEALASLGEIVNAAVADNPDDPTIITPEIRLQAVRVSADEFVSQLLERVAAAIVGQAPAATADVAKRRAGSWKGLM
jgi:hypothetical protein